MCLEPGYKRGGDLWVLTATAVAVVGASLVPATGAPEGITSYGLHTEAPPWVSLTWLQKEMRFPGPVRYLTVCLHLRLHFLYTDPGLVFHIDGSHFAAVYEGVYALFNAKYFWSTQEDVRLREWRHVCFLLGSEAKIYVQGRHVSGKRHGHAGDPPPFVEPRNLTLGVPGGLVDLTNMAPVGAFYTLPLVFYRKLSDEELQALANCQTVPEGEVSGEGSWKLISTDGENDALIQNNPWIPMDTVLLHGPSTYDASEVENLTRSAVMAQVEERAICSQESPERLLLVRAAKHKYLEAERLCALYGGSLLHLLHQDMLKALRKVMSARPNMMLFAWMKSTGNSSCRSLTLPNTEDTPLHMSVGCGHTANELLCQVSWSPHMELRHNGPVEIDDRFYLVPREMVPRFVSPRARQISFLTPKALVMHDAEGRLLASTSVQVFQPMGRHVWREAQANITRNMVLTSCKQDEFTCDDGWCLPLSSRCNGVNDCGDGSDELCSVLLPLPSSYRADRPPRLRTQLALTARLVRVHDVDVVNNHITAWLQLNTQWRDGSVLLSQLSDTSLDNILLQEGDNKIWTPRYALSNAVFHDRISYDQHHNSFVVTFASKTTEGRVDFIEGFEGYVYNASMDAILERQENFMAAFICDFDLTIFPFDVHECNINISIINRGTFYSTFEPERIRVKSSPSTLTLFEASQLRYQCGSTNGNVDTISFRVSLDTISFRVLLRRQFGSYVLTTFLPCWVLGVIGFGTLYFRFTDFSDRISVTLSCLIVIAALYSQITFTIPQSSSPKLIDVYFFYFIVRLFKTFVHHSVLYFIGNCKKRQHGRSYGEDEEFSAMRKTAVDTSGGTGGFEPASGTRSEAESDASINHHDPAPKPRTATVPSQAAAPPKPSRNYARIFNLASIGWGIGIDIACIALFFYWIFSSRQRVINQFNESLA